MQPGTLSVDGILSGWSEVRNHGRPSNRTGPDNPIGEAEKEADRLLVHLMKSVARWSIARCSYCKTLFYPKRMLTQTRKPSGVHSRMARIRSIRLILYGADDRT